MSLRKAMSTRSRLFGPPKRSLSGTPKKTTERSLSRLEKLPVELLQKIFLYAESIAFARCSPHIAAAASSDLIIQQFSMRVLFPPDEAVPDNDQASGTDVAAVAESPAIVNAGGQPERRSVRLIRNTGRLWRGNTDSLKSSTEILGCRFMTWERFKTYVQLGLPTFDASHFDHPYRLPSTFQGLKYLEKEQIPRKLLRGPWTDDKAAFLYFLCWVGLRAPKFCESIANDGLREAVSQQVPRAVAALVSPCVMARPTTKLLCSAVIDHDCHLAIVRLLLVPWEKGTGTGPPPFLDFQDIELARWIETQKCRGNRKGFWLGARLKEARFGILRHTSRTFGGDVLDVSADEDAIIPIPVGRLDAA